MGAPGVIAQIGGPRRVIFGRRAGNGEREIELLRSFTEAGWNAELSEAILRDLWTKLCFIGPFAAANTITGLSAERMCVVERCERLVQMVMADLVLFTVKSYDTDEGIACIRPAVGPRTTILTLQNGVDSGESLAAAFGWERV